MIRVTDHALVRFMARAGGFDVDGLRAAIAASLERAHVAAQAVRARRYVIVVDGLRYVVEDGHLVTVLEEDMKLGRLHRPAPEDAER